MFVFMTWANFVSKSQFTQNVIFHDPTLTKVELQHKLFAWQCTLNKSCSLSFVEQTLFKANELMQCLTWSNRAHKNQQNAISRLRNFAIQNADFSFKCTTLELCNQLTMMNQMLLPKVKLEISHSSTTFTNIVSTDSPRIRSYGGEKIEFQVVSSELKQALLRASWPTSTGHVSHVVAICRCWPTLPCHKGEHSVALALTRSFTLSPSTSRSHAAPEQSKAQRRRHRVITGQAHHHRRTITQSTSHVAPP